MTAKKQFVVVMPREGTGAFNDALLFRLFAVDDPAPTHFWVNTAQEPPCFIMENAAFQKWVDQGGHHLRMLTSPRNINIQIDDSEELNQAVETFGQVAGRHTSVTA